MALTVHQQPQELTPAYNKQTIVALSDQLAAPDFIYRVGVIVNGDVANIFAQNIAPRPDGYLVVDPIEWVKNYIKHYFNPNINLAIPIEIATGKTVSVQVIIIENYGGVDHVAPTIEYQAFDACLTDDDFRNYNFNDYIFGGTTGKYFLSKTIDTITPDPRVVIGQDLWLHFILNPALVIDNIVMTQKRGASTIEVVNISSGGIPTPVNSYDTYVMQVGTNIFAAPLVGDTVTIEFKDAGAIRLLQYTYTIKDLCTKYQPYTIYYMDRDGNIPFFHFEFLSRQTRTKKINQATLSKDTLNTTTHQYGSKSWQREKHVVSTAIETSLQLNTGWINDLQSVQITQLWGSPLHWLWNGTILKAISPPQEQNYEVKYSVNDKLFNYPCIVDLGVTETSQRGI